jgi:hypothetical protein
MSTTNWRLTSLASLVVCGLAWSVSADELPSSLPADSLHDRALGVVRCAKSPSG